MELCDFNQAVTRLSGADIHRLAAEIHARHTTAAADVAWWHATIAIERALRASGRLRMAAMAAMAASRAVQCAAAAHGVPLPDDDVTWVARAAADIARGLCAGEGAERETAHLLGCWDAVLAAAAAVPA